MYAIVSKIGHVIEAPVNMRSSYNGVGGFHKLSAEQLKEHGWYPCDVVNESFNPRFESRNPPIITFDGERVTVTHQIIPKSLEAIKTETAEMLAAIRYEKETAGITVNGIHLLTDDRSKSLLVGKALKASIDPATTCNWKTPAGWVTLNAEQLISLATTLDAYVQACFDREGEIAAQIDAATTVAEIEAIDLNAGWPDNG
jgi:hypothetical protein